MKKREHKEKDKGEGKQRKEEEQLLSKKDRKGNRNSRGNCPFCHHEMRADKVEGHKGGKVCKKWQSEIV